MTLDFHTNKRELEEVSTLPIKHLHNKMAVWGYRPVYPHGYTWPHWRKWPNSSEQAAQITQLIGVPCGIDRDQLDDQGNLVS
jgi:hypothetical protein